MIAGLRQRCAAANLSVLRKSNLHLSTPWATSLVTTQSTPHSPAHYFHTTSARRLFETPGQVAAAVAGIGAGWFIFRALRKRIALRIALGLLGQPNIVPPFIWTVSADPHTFAGVVSAVDAGFKLARSHPMKASALREATFAMPSEIARLNKDAPEFKIEDMGPCSELSTQFLGAAGVFKPDFDLKKDWKIFLYYPNGAQKATAAFLAISADLHVSNPHKHDYIRGGPRLPGTTPYAGRDNESSNNSIRNPSVIRAATMMWRECYRQWKQHSPDIIENRIQPGQLPVIFCFRETTCGSIFDPALHDFPNPASLGMVVGLVEPKMAAPWEEIS